MSKVNINNLGHTVTSRVINWGDLVRRAWGSEFFQPDHNIYEFTNRKFDSTDRGLTGLYGVVGDQLLLADGTPYPDMRDGLIAGVGTAPGAARRGLGNYEEILRDPTGANSVNGVSLSGGNPPLPHLCIGGPVWAQKVAPTADKWSTLAYGTGGLLVSLGINAATGNFRAMYSLDYGQTWTISPSSPGYVGGHTPQARSVTYGGGVFVQFLNAAYYFRSTDGINWVQGTWFNGGPTQAAFANGLFAIGCGYGVAISTDLGLSWTNYALPGNVIPMCLAYSTGSTWLAVDFTGRAYLSTDNCHTWATTGTTGVAPYQSAIAYANGTWIVGQISGSLGICVSTNNGATWTSTSLVVSGGTVQASNILFAQNTFIVTDPGGQNVYTSTDAVTWHKSSNPLPNPGAAYWVIVNDGGVHYAGVPALDGSFATAYGTC